MSGMGFSYHLARLSKLRFPSKINNGLVTDFATKLN